MSVYGRHWLPGADGKYTEGLGPYVDSSYGGRYWIHCKHPERYVRTFSQDDPYRAHAVGIGAELQAAGVDLFGDHPAMPSRTEIESWLGWIFTVWGAAKDDEEPEFPEGTIVWDDTYLLAERFLIPIVDGDLAYAEPPGPRQYSHIIGFDQAFPSPRDYNRAIEERVELAWFRYKIAQQARRIFHFGVSGGRPLEPE